MPMDAMSPVVGHGGRFDFELAEQHRIKEGRKAKQGVLKRKDSFSSETTNASAGVEMWPGSY